MAFYKTQYTIRFFDKDAVWFSTGRENTLADVRGNIYSHVVRFGDAITYRVYDSTGFLIPNWYNLPW